jgi:hypothetical protein
MATACERARCVKVAAPARHRGWPRYGHERPAVNEGKSRIRRVKEGIEFLGFVVFPDQLRVNRRAIAASGDGYAACEPPMARGT